MDFGRMDVKKTLKNKKDRCAVYGTDLNLTQTILLMANIEGVLRYRRKYRAVEIYL